ncbi:MAG: DinB family protein [Raineya sp.]
MEFTANLSPNEYPPYAKIYLEHLESNDILSILEKRKNFVKNFYQNISEEQANFAYAAGKWSIKEVLLHVVDSERVFAYRAMSFARGETKPLPGFDQDLFVQNSFALKRSLASIIAEFEAVRLASLSLYQNFTPEILLNEGNANGFSVTTRAFAALSAGHEIHHTKVIAEKYLPLL